MTRVRLSDGAQVECDFAVVGVGVTPRSALASDAGLDVDDGIVVDECLLTSAPNIYAAGDVANAWHPFYERRIPTWRRRLIRYLQLAADKARK